MCALGSVNMRRKNCVILPAAGRRTQLFHFIFTEPRAHQKVHPCTLAHWIHDATLVKKLKKSNELRLRRSKISWPSP